MKHRKQSLIGFLQKGFYNTLTENKCFKNTCEPADFLGKN